MELDGQADAPARDRLRDLVAHLVASMADPVLSPMVPALVEAAERDPTIAARFHDGNDRRRAALVDALAAGVRAGELRANLDPDLAALALAGAVTYRRLLTGEPMPADRVGPLVDLVLGPAPT